MYSNLYKSAIEAFLREFEARISATDCEYNYTPEFAHMHMDLGRRTGKSTCALEIVWGREALLVVPMMHMTGCMRQQYAQRFGKDTNLIVTSRQVDCNIFRQHRLPKVSLIVIDEPFLHGKKYMKSWHKTAKDLRVPVIHLGTMRRVNIED